MRNLLFLDLEDTVIDSFDYYGSVFFKNIDLVKSTINRFRIDEIGIFSFALHTEKERLSFCSYTLPELQKQINKEITIPIHTIKEDIIPLFRQSRKNYYSTVRKFLMNMSKKEAFLHYADLLYSSDNVFLLDDAVQTETIDRGDTSCMLLNVYAVNGTFFQ